MAAKSVTVARDAAGVISQIQTLAAEGRVEQTPLQNGVRLRVSMGAAIDGLNVYPSKGGGCKIVFDQPESAFADEVVRALQAVASTPAKAKAATGPLEPVLPDAACWVGSDESGKGDYFGPLVVAAVALRGDEWRAVEVLGAADSKKLTDLRVMSLADDMAAYPHEAIVINPPRYNELWTKMGSVNRVLAWAHARAIENVLEKAPGAVAAVADQFGDESLIRNALFERGRDVRLLQMPRAERDPAVAAASIIARATFLRRLEALGRQAGMRLPKGASATVESAARQLVASQGREALGSYAKLHFRTTSRVT